MASNNKVFLLSHRQDNQAVWGEYDCGSEDMGVVAALKTLIENVQYEGQVVVSGICFDRWGGVVVYSKGDERPYRSFDQLEIVQERLTR